MSEAPQQQPFPPGPQHEQIRANAGAWQVECTYFMGPEPMVVQATETVEMLGDYWSVSRFSCDMMGMPFQGRATMGYDPVREVWVSTWIDSMSPFLFHMEGNYDEAGKVLTLGGRAARPWDGVPVDYRMTLENIEDGKRRFEMFHTGPDGAEIQMASYIYTRAG